MDFFCRVTPEGLVPLDDIDWEQKKQLRIGSDVRVHITMPRNIKFHRKFFALLNITFDNLPESIQAEKHINSMKSLLSLIKVHLGYYDIVQVDGRNVINLHSISFAKMDETEFSRFYDRAVTDILHYFLQGTDRNILLQEVELLTNTNKLSITK